MAERPNRESTALPPVRRKKRRRWGRLLARIMCVIFAVIALVPVGVGLLVRTSWARGIAEAQTRALLKGYGIDARYDLELNLWPLSVGLRNLRVESTDGQGPFLTARRATARPKIFGLLAGKLVIDEVEIVQPSARVVLIDGKLKNLDLHLPETKKSDGSTKPPFAVISTSEANVDITIDSTHLVAKDIDADVTTDDADGGTAYEVAIRAAEARSKMVRALPNGEYAVDEDLLCRMDGRARIEPKRVVVRRFSTHGVADLDPAEDTFGACDLAKTDKRYVELALGHLTVQMPPGEVSGQNLPGIDGHLHVRGPLHVIERWQTKPGFDGSATVDTEVRIPMGPLKLDRLDASGRVEVNDIRLYKFEFSRHFDLDFSLRNGVAKVPKLHVEIAKGIADINDVEVGLMNPHFPIKANLDIHDVVFTKLLADLKIHPHSHVTWDVNDLKVPHLEGTIVPLDIEGDMTAHTSNFAVYDKPVDSAGPKNRATGIKEGLLQARLGIHPKALEFMNTTVTGPHSVVRNLLVSIGYDEAINVQIPNANIDLRDLSPLGSVVIAGQADLKATVTGFASDPRIAGEVNTIKGFSIGEKPNDIAFGDLLGARVHLEGLNVILEDVRGQKNKSTFEMPTGRLEFGGEANLRMDGAIVTKGMDVRDFFSVFHLDEDPRFEKIHANLEANARVHLALGGPEDTCGGGFIDVQGTTIAHQVDLFDEKFDEAQADFEYRWADRQAGIEGADIDIRSVALSKVKKEGRPAIGNILGSISIVRGGDMRGSVVMQGYPLQRADLLGEAAPLVEGSVSGVARIGGTVSDFEVEADVDVTPIRVMGAPFGSSDLHVVMTQKSDPVKEIGRTQCKGRITAPFDKDAYFRNLAKSNSGDITINGKLFDGQVALENVNMTRQQKAVLTGKVSFDKFDLNPVGRLFSSGEEGDGAGQNGLGGELTGALVVEKFDMGDPGHAKAHFEPKTIKVAREGQRLEWRPPPTTQTRIELEGDKVTLPPMVFDLAATNGFKGAVGVTGFVTEVTHGGNLDLTAELTPIDLGVLVGIVPRLTRAGGSLAGKLHVAGTASSPTFKGQLRVRAGDFAIKGAPGALTDVEIDIDADENEVRVSRGKGHFLGGDVGITGRMPISGGTLGAVEASVTGRQLFVSPVEGAKATVDADLTVSINPTASSAQGRLPFISGDVTITAFEYTRPFTLELNGLTRQQRTSVADSYDPAGDSVTFGVDVKSRVPLRLRNNMIDAQLAIDPRGVRVTGTNQRVGLRGELSMLSGGRFRVFANDFDLKKGTIRFDDPTRIVPHIDITAVTEYRRYTNTLTSGSSGSAASSSSAGAAAASGSIAGGGGSGGNLWRITVHAYGDTDNKLQIDMTSEPPLSREDIFFLLTIGLTRAEVDLVQAGSVYGAVAFEAFGTATGVDRAVKQAIPVIDDFRPGTAYSPRTGRVEPNITVGRRLTDTIRARLTSGLAEDPQLRSAIEWRLNRHFTVEPSYDRINTVSSSNIGNFGLDFRWSLEFD